MSKRKIGLLGIATSLVGALFAGTYFAEKNDDVDDIYSHGVFVRNLTQEEIDHPIYAQPFEVYDSLATDNKKYKNGDQDCSMNILGDGTNMKDIWNAYRGDGTTIAIIDTGIDYDNPDFKFADGSSKILDTSRYYYNYNGAINYNQYNVAGTSSYNFLDHSTWDKQGLLESHGTNVASTAASAINGKDGCVGIAPNANLLILKTDMKLNSISYAINYAVEQGVDVINMSLGAYATSFTDGNGVEQTGYASTSTALSSAITTAYNAGIIVVAAAGNENTSYPSYPANNTHVIGVGALASGNYSKASFSNFNQTTSTINTKNVNVDLTAPGYVYAADETATNNNGTPRNRSHGYKNTQGTSFASPIVAGAAALWKQAHPTGTPDQFESALYAACDDIGTSGWDTTYGHGALNLKKLLLSDSATPTSISVKAKDNVVRGKSGDHVQLYTQTLPLTSAEKSVVWSSSDSSIASVNDYSGVLTFGSKSGSATLTATSTANSSARGTIEVTNTTSVPVASVSFTNKTVTINKDSSGDVLTTFPYTVLPSGANQNVIFECNDPDSLEVDDGEWVSADVDKTVLLTVKSQEDPSKFDTCTVIIGDGGGNTGETGGAAESKTLAYGPVTFNAGLPSDNNWTGTSGSYCGGYGRNKNGAWSVTLDFEKATSIDWNKVDFSKPVSLTNQVTACSNSGSGTVTLSLDNTSKNSTSTNLSNFGSGSGVSNAKLVNMDIASVTSSFKNLTISFPAKSFITNFGCTLSYTTKGSNPVPQDYTVTFNSNGGSGTMASATTNGSSFDVPECTFTKTNYEFDKWALGSATGTKYSVGDTITGISSNITLYATWKAKIINYTVTFNSNGGSGTMSNATTNGSSYVVPACDFTKANYEFDKWALNSATGTKYDVGATISNISSNITLYATWKAKVVNYSVSFNANGGSGTMSNATTNGSSYVTPSCDFSNSGYTFDGWALNSATGTKYSVGATISNISSNITLYATWKANSSSGGGDEYKYYTGNYYTPITESQISAGGTTLITALKNLIQPKTEFGYSNIWTFNENYDKYPSNYDGTDPLTGNAYPTTNNTSKRGKMWDMYSDQTWTGSSQRAGSYHTIGDSYNREHSMPKSWFGGSDSNKPGTDPNHLFNTDGQVNNYRSNFAYGEVVSSITFNGYTFSGKKATGFGILGKNSSGTTVFEPDDAYKGDFARAQMYMATAYYDWNLTQDSNGAYCFSYSNNVSTMKPYYINLLTKWSAEDPVSQKEIDRNNAVYNNSTQKNRNPFIDHPTWANKIWGGTPYTWNGKTSDDETNNVDGVSLDKISLELNVGDSATLTPTVSPNNATNKNVTWESSDTSVATVSGGVVTAVSSGNAIITVKTVDGNKTATCKVTVKSSGSSGGTTYYTKITNTSELTSGEYLIVCEAKNTALNGSLGSTAIKASGNHIGVTINEKKIEATETVNGYSFAYDSEKGSLLSSSGLYIYHTGSSNTLDTSSSAQLNTITFDASGNAKIVCGSYQLCVNGDLYRYYKTSSVSSYNAVQLYKKDAGSTPVNPEIKGITLSETSKSIDLYSDSKTFTLTPTVSFVGDIDTTVSWTTSDSSVALISANTSANGTPITITANKVGSTTITATCGGKSATCTVVITDTTNANTIKSLEIVTDVESIPFMEGNGKYTVSAKLIATFQDNHTQEVEPEKSNFEISTSSLGYKTITASYGGLSVSKDIRISNNKSDIGETTEGTYNESSTSTSASSSVNKWNTPSGITISSNATGVDTAGRGFQWSKTAAKVTLKGYTNISKIEVTVSANCSISSVAVSVGGASFGVSQSVSEGDKNKVLVFSNSTLTKASSSTVMNGDIVITSNEGSKSFYIKNIDVTTVTGSTGETHDATAFEQAKAWSQYFLDLTSPICSANPDGDNAESLSDVWGELSSEYNYMDADSKSEFLSSTDSTITDARERYMHIASHYGVNIEDLTKAQFTNNKGINLFDNLNVLDSEHPTTFLTVILSLVGVASIGGYFIIKKRKEI